MRKLYLLVKRKWILKSFK
ncbi:hypothetical protein CAEBREN_13924 [Caenorhabditis brenneri]|uniref:Uncharacterized protein n=1 Tax=Caenorhabditis brenneri TaxID=135651 RepID=G0N0T8_CAEBE|nr:hypothetical protein CAEBREN_13924 [Caenorhabditis brenneri]